MRRRTRRTLPDHQVVVGRDFRGCGLVAVEAVEQQLDGVLRDLRLVRTDRGQAGGAVAAVLDIVEADEGNVLGDANFTEVRLWDCGPAGGQIWQPQPNGSLLNPQSGRCLDSPGGVTADGSDLQIYDCNGLDPQKWNIPA